MLSLAPVARQRGGLEAGGMMASMNGANEVGRRGEQAPSQGARESDGANGTFGESLRVFATTPPSYGAEGRSYLQSVREIARWSEAAGCEGTLVYTDNGLVDPWLVSQAIVEATERICPLVAVQPVYMHPYTAAKMVASLAFMYGRRIWLNMVAGGFVNDLLALGDNTPHDQRYERAIEYVRIVLGLLSGEATTLNGTYYQVNNLRLRPRIPEELRPGLLMSGSSPAGFAAARALGAVPVKYPKPPGEEDATGDPLGFGVRIGIIARASEDDAWRVAHERFPVDRTGQIAHSLAMKVSDSRWHHQLGARETVEKETRSPYWLVPFENYKTFCPYFVGGHSQVAALVAEYVRLGARTFILDVPASPEELHHSSIVLRAAVEAAG